MQNSRRRSGPELQVRVRRLRPKMLAVKQHVSGEKGEKSLATLKTQTFRMKTFYWKG